MSEQSAFNEDKVSFDSEYHGETSLNISALLVTIDEGGISGEKVIEKPATNM